MAIGLNVNESRRILEIVPIVGMAGIGKTTLARRVYDESGVDRHFDIHYWTTVSQEYSSHKVLASLLDSGNRAPVRLSQEYSSHKVLVSLQKSGSKLTMKKMEEMDEEQLALKLYQSLKGRRYLIVIDDVWDNDILDAVRRYLPDDNNRSRVLMTTRLSKVAQYACPQNPLCPMGVLCEDDSWNLLHNEIFTENDCPSELEPIGRKIAKICKGLPLAIVVTAGFMSKVCRTKENWASLADNLSSLVAKDDGECMKILSLSYKLLPHHLKSSFLYMAMFPEDYVIHVPKLLRLWVAEGFLKLANKPICREALAEEYLEDLVERNLLLVWTRSLSGKIKTCKIHDMLLKFCIQTAQKEGFLQVMKYMGNVRQDFVAPRGIFIHKDDYSFEKFLEIMSRGINIHSLIYTRGYAFNNKMRQFFLGDHDLLKVLDLSEVKFFAFPDAITRLVNLRYLSLYCFSIRPSISQLQNLETLVLWGDKLWREWGANPCATLPVEILIMRRSRYICARGFSFIYPPDWETPIKGLFLLENLQTLKINLTWGNNILRRMPNLKKLKIYCSGIFNDVWQELAALANLHQLEILSLFFDYPVNPEYMQYSPKLYYPQTLKRLTLRGCNIPWKSLTSVGSLPYLEYLKLCHWACWGEEWEPNVNEFRQLKYLQLEELDLKEWKADEKHFPRLKCLIIKWCTNLREIPTGIVDIPTLEEIRLVDNGRLDLASVQQIQKEQQELGNDILKVVFERTAKQSS